MRDDQIKHMVDRFLGWKFPESINPDGGLSFDFRVHKPVGTNLLSATEADAMVRYMIEGMPGAGFSESWCGKMAGLEEAAGDPEIGAGPVTNGNRN